MGYSGEQAETITSGRGALKAVEVGLGGAQIYLGLKFGEAGLVESVLAFLNAAEGGET